ncbi:MAG: DUF1499 domain-containing protein [Alphaproteobacteria bacterium]|nr:MAG: DUF1499 domain-containing protein [Alphaproteobacteria bacterium]
MARTEAYLHGPIRRAYFARRIQADPVSRLALWARRVAGFAVAVLLLAIVIVRGGILEIIPSLGAVGGAFILAMIAVLLALGAFVVIWREGLQGFGMAVTALLVGLAILGYPAYLGLKGYRLPAIADITTDPIDPPRFEAIARLRSRDANPIVYAGLRAAELQRAAYPSIEPLIVSVTPQMAYDAAVEVINKRKWRIVDARAPQAGRRDGRIEAVARTPIFGFRDDVVVRVRSDPDGARVDMRSTSRYGRHDFGTNASRVSALSEAIDEAVDNLKPEKTPEQVKKPKKTDAKAKNQPADKRR